MIVLSATLGLWFGIMPGLYGIHLALLMLFLILNVNLGIFLFFAGLGKALAFPAAPILYGTGVWMIEHGSGLIKPFSMCPIVGLTDFSRYAVVGGLVIGPVLGIVAGMVMAWMVTGFRRKWINLQQKSDTLRRWQGKKSVRFLQWLLVGKGAKDVRKVMESKSKVVRKGSIVTLLVLAVASVGVLKLYGNCWITRRTAQTLTTQNGAEVNIRKMNLSLLTAKVSITGLEITDPQKPTHNSFAVESISSDVSFLNLLAGKIIMDEVIVSGIAFDQKRKQPGFLVEALQPTDPSDTDDAFGDLIGDKLSNYFNDPETLISWLKKIDGWLQRTQQDKSKQKEDKRADRSQGYLSARAAVEPAPRLLIKKAVLDKIQIPFELIGLSRLEIQNASDMPALTGKPLLLKLTSYKNSIQLDLALRFDQPQPYTQITGSFTDIDLADLQKQLSKSNHMIFQQGSVSGDITGSIRDGVIDMAIRVTTKDMQADTSRGKGLFGLDAKTSKRAVAVLNRLETTLRIVGPMSQPRLIFDAQELQETLQQALLQEGQDILRKEIDKGVDKALKKLLDQFK